MSNIQKGAPTSGMDLTHTISVVIPTYNRALSLEVAVRSCLSQTHAVHEVIVCDDGSTDDSQARMAAIGDARVIWIASAHTGRPAVPRNKGIAAATGQWLAFLDSDDAWRPEKLAAQMQRMTRAGTRACCSNAERILPADIPGGVYFNDAPELFGLDQLLQVNRVICSSALVKRELVMHVGGFPEAPELRALEDYALWLRIAAHTSFAYCPEPLVRYADHPMGSIRAGAMDVNAQRDAVFTDLLEWEGNGAFTKGQRRMIIRQLCRARRYAGRPIKDWLFLR